MTRRIDSLTEIAQQFDAIVLDQWGVLHNGTAPYRGAIGCLRGLAATGSRLALLSNSGKRAAPNADRIAAMGFERKFFEVVMTSGEALWQDIAHGLVSERVFFPIERAAGDAAQWTKGLEVRLVDQPSAAEALLLMGLPDGAGPNDFGVALEIARAADLPVICTNPDRASPRADGQTVLSPGTLAHTYADAGGDVRFYGKPYPPVFRALEAALGARPKRLLMVGDSLEHDIAGANAAGWTTCFVEGGLHAADLVTGDPDGALQQLVATRRAPTPDYAIARLQ